MANTSDTGATYPPKCRSGRSAEDRALRLTPKGLDPASARNRVFFARDPGGGDSGHPGQREQALEVLTRLPRQLFVTDTT